MNFQTMSKQRKFVLISAAAGVISMFLPWVRISIFGFSQSQNGLHNSGILVFLCFAIAGVIACVGDQSKNLNNSMWMVTLIASAVALIIIIWDLIDASSSLYGSYLSFGIYIAGLSAIGVLLSAFIFRSATDNIRDGFESLKKDINSRIRDTSSDNITDNTNPNQKDSENSNN